jgi:hypothetical protein
MWSDSDIPEDHTASIFRLKLYNCFLFKELPRISEEYSSSVIMIKEKMVKLNQILMDW